MRGQDRTAVFNPVSSRRSFLKSTLWMGAIATGAGSLVIPPAWVLLYRVVPPPAKLRRFDTRQSWCRAVVMSACPARRNCTVDTAENLPFATAVGGKLSSRPTPECLKSVLMPQEARVGNPGRSSDAARFEPGSRRTH